jgi:hypothetical protein
MARFLLLSCSSLKKRGALPIAALERYDGPAFRVVRRYLRGNPSEPPAIRIISAHFGLISGHDLVPLYDRNMTPKRVIELRPLIRKSLEEIWERTVYSDVFVCAAGRYEGVLEDSWPLLGRQGVCQRAKGSIGGKIAQLRDWLYKAEEQPFKELLSLKRAKGAVVLRGISLKVSPEEVMALARREMGKNEERTQDYQAWYVPVDGSRIAPKWLVSKLTGLPVERFRTADALKVLVSLGVEVRRL